MKVNFGAAIKNGWRFALNPKRLILEAVSLALAIILILVTLVDVVGKISATQTTNILTIAQFGTNFIISLIVISLYFAFLHGTFVHNYSDQRSISKSAGVVKSRYLKLIFAIIPITILSVAFNIIFDGLIFPGAEVGSVLGIIIGLLFYFVYQEVIIDKKGALGALQGSYKIFRNNMFAVALTLVISLAVVIALIVAFVVLVLISVAFGSTLSVILASGVLIVSGIIFFIGLAIAILMTLGIQTDVYLQLKGRRRAAKAKKRRRRR